MSKPFAMVTGASSGIGLELAAICAQEGFDLLVMSGTPGAIETDFSERHRRMAEPGSAGNADE